MSFRIIIPGNVFFPLPPFPPCSVFLGHSSKCKYGSASNYVQHYEQLLQNPNKHSTSVSRTEKLKKLPVDDLSCGNVQNLNENGTKQMDNIIESKCFPTNVPVGEETFILLLLWLLWIDMLVGISSPCMTFPRTKLWPQTMCRFGERNFPSHVVHILISFRNMLTYTFFFLWQGLWLNW